MHLSALTQSNINYMNHLSAQKSSPHEIIQTEMGYTHDDRSIITDNKPHQPDLTKPPQRITSKVFKALKEIITKELGDGL